MFFRGIWPLSAKALIPGVPIKSWVEKNVIKRSKIKIIICNFGNLNPEHVKFADQIFSSKSLFKRSESWFSRRACFWLLPSGERCLIRSDKRIKYEDIIKNTYTDHYMLKCGSIIAKRMLFNILQLKLISTVFNGLFEPLIGRIV